MVSVDASAFAAKYQSKREVYRFLTHDCGIYLPTYETVTVYHMRDIVANKRRKIKSTDVKHISVPNFEGLKIETMLEYAEQHPDAMEVLPIIPREREKLPRQYIANAIHTIIGDPFKAWVDQKVNERHELRREPQDAIQLDPDIHAIFS